MMETNTTSSSNQKIRKRHQCSNCHEFEHSKRNCPLLKDSSWRDVTVGEFKAFIAICLALGYVKFTNREVAFQDHEFGSLFIRRLMSLERFNLILRCWHWENVGDANRDFERKEKKRQIHSGLSMVSVS